MPYLEEHWKPLKEHVIIRVCLEWPIICLNVLLVFDMMLRYPSLMRFSADGGPVPKLLGLAVVPPDFTTPPPPLFSGGGVVYDRYELEGNAGVLSTDGCVVVVVAIVVVVLTGIPVPVVVFAVERVVVGRVVVVVRRVVVVVGRVVIFVGRAVVLVRTVDSCRVVFAVVLVAIVVDDVVVVVIGVVVVEVGVDVVVELGVDVVEVDVNVAEELPIDFAEDISVNCSALVDESSAVLDVKVEVSVPRAMLDVESSTGCEVLSTPLVPVSSV